MFHQQLGQCSTKKSLMHRCKLSPTKELLIENRHKVKETGHDKNMSYLYIKNVSCPQFVSNIRINGNPSSLIYIKSVVRQAHSQMLWTPATLLMMFKQNSAVPFVN